MKSSLALLYKRIDQVRMSPADRAQAKASLAQADAVADALLVLGGALKRLFALRPTALHSRA